MTLSFCTDFHPRILGLTGTQEQIDSVTKSYRIYYSKSAKDSDNDYLVMANCRCYHVIQHYNCHLVLKFVALSFPMVVTKFVGMLLLPYHRPSMS